MKVTLKKGSELARQAIEAAAKTNAPAETSVSFYAKGEPSEFVVTAYETASIKFVSAVSDTRALLETGYEIRRLLNKANNFVPAGDTQSISDLLTERAMIEAQEKRLGAHISQAETGLAEPSIDETISRIQQQLALVAKGNEGARFMERSFEMRAVDENTLETMRGYFMELRRKKSDLTDMLHGRNLNTKITLSDAAITVLKHHKIIA